MNKFFMTALDLKKKYLKPKFVKEARVIVFVDDLWYHLHNDEAITSDKDFAFCIRRNKK